MADVLSVGAMVGVLGVCAAGVVPAVAEVGAGGDAGTALSTLPAAVSVSVSGTAGSIRGSANRPDGITVFVTYPGAAEDAAWDGCDCWD